MSSSCKFRLFMTFARTFHVTCRIICFRLCQIHISHFQPTQVRHFLYICEMNRLYREMAQGTKACCSISSIQYLFPFESNIEIQFTLCPCFALLVLNSRVNITPVSRHSAASTILKCGRYYLIARRLFTLLIAH